MTEPQPPEQAPDDAGVGAALRALGRELAGLGLAVLKMYAAFLPLVAVIFAVLKATGATDQAWWWILPYDAGVCLIVLLVLAPIAWRRSRRGR